MIFCQESSITKSGSVSKDGQTLLVIHGLLYLRLQGRKYGNTPERNSGFLTTSVIDAIVVTGHSIFPLNNHTLKHPAASSKIHLS